MSLIADILPVTSISDNPDYKQPKEEATSTQGATEMGVLLTLFAATVENGNMVFYIDTAVNNSEDRYVRLGTITTLTSAPADFPATYYAYFAGPGVAGSGTPGVARWVKVGVTMGTGSSVTFDAQAILKP